MKAAIYIRKLRENNDKPSYRFTVQREQLPAHAKAQGWNAAIYDDGHASAAQGKTEALPERARLEKDIRASSIDVPRGKISPARWGLGARASRPHRTSQKRAGRPRSQVRIRGGWFCPGAYGLSGP